jgi:hypothetical protein
LRDGRLEVLEGAGHLFLLTHLETVADMVETFLDQTASQGEASSPRSALPLAVRA